MSTQVFFCGYLVTRLHCTCQIDLFNWVFFCTFWLFSEIFKISDGLRRIDNISDVIKASMEFCVTTSFLDQKGDLLRTECLKTLNVKSMLSLRFILIKHPVNKTTGSHNVRWRL